MEQNLKETVKITGGALVFETDGGAFFALFLGHGQEICAIFWFSFPTGQDCALFCAGEDLLLSIKHVIEHFIALKRIISLINYSNKL